MSSEAYDNYLEKMCQSNSADEDAVEAEEAVYRQLMSEGKFLTAGEEG